jgi:hypothetical protein
MPYNIRYMPDEALLKRRGDAIHLDRQASVAMLEVMRDRSSLAIRNGRDFFRLDQSMRIPKLVQLHI